MCTEVTLGISCATQIPKCPFPGLIDVGLPRMALASAIAPIEARAVVFLQAGYHPAFLKKVWQVRARQTLVRHACASKRSVILVECASSVQPVT